MINLSTPNTALLNELSTEYDKAVYWLRKHYKGDKGYERMRHDLFMKACLQRKHQTSDIVEYKSPNGNRWKVFEHCMYFPDRDAMYTNAVAFVYYETYGSVGAFFLGQSDNGIRQCVIYTSHFFYQMCQRLGVQMRSSEMIARFIQMIPMQIVKTHTERGTDGLIHVDVALPGSIGRGILRTPLGSDDIVFEIRTFLTEQQLNGKQRRETADLRKAGRELKYEPETLRIERIANTTDIKGTLRTEIERMTLTGIPKEVSEHIVHLSMMLGYTMMEAGYISEREGVYVGKLCRDVILEAAWRMYRYPDGTNETKEMLLIALYVARHHHIRQFSLKHFLRTMLELIKPDYIKQYADGIEQCEAIAETYRQEVKKMTGFRPSTLYKKRGKMTNPASSQ